MLVRFRIGHTLLKMEYAWNIARVQTKEIHRNKKEFTETHTRC